MSTAPAPSPAPYSARTTRRPRGWGRARSARWVANRIALHQAWTDRSGILWTVVALHRHERLARIETGSAFHYVPFTVLGRDYRLGQAP
jgi:hypothetical protein